jgi:hypothetical protein
MAESMRWVHRPEAFPGESLASYLRHFARHNFLRSRGALLRAVQASPGARPNSSEVSRLADALGVPYSTIEQMAPSDAPVVPALRRSLTRAQGDAVCPDCLRQASYSRRAWSHQLATACPEHSLQLVDQCPECGGQLRHDRPLAHICDCGHDLRGVKSALAAPLEVEVALLLEGSTPARLSLPIDLSNGVPADIDLFLVEFMYHFGVESGNVRPVKVSGATPAPRSVAQARAGLTAIAQVTKDWPTNFSGAVAELMRRSPHGQGGPVSARLGSWYRTLFRRFGHSAYDAIRTVAANIVVLQHDGPIDPRKRELLSACTVKKDWVSLTEAARELGVTPARLAKGADDGRIQAFFPDTGYRQRCVTRSEIDRLSALRSDYCDKGVAAQALGVPASVFSILAEAGLIALHDAETLAPVIRGCVSRSALQALTQRLLEGLQCIDGPGGEYLALRDLNLRRTTDRQRMVDLCRSISDGSFAAAGHDGTGVIGGILFSKHQVQERIASFSVGVHLNMQQISALTGAHYDAVKTWVDTGVLPAKRTTHQANPNLVDLRDFVQFLLEYSPLASLAPQLGSSSRGLAELFTRRDVQLVGQGERRGVLVRIRDLARPQAAP